MNTLLKRFARYACCAATWGHRNARLVPQVAAWRGMACSVACLGSLLFPSAYASPFETTLNELVGRALATNPRVRAAVHVLNQAVATHEETLAFFDPNVVAVAGRSERGRAVPGATGISAPGNTATSAHVGIELAFQPGAYVSVGAAERFLAEPPGDYGHVYQSVFGVQCRIPLLRDRGFRTWSLSRAAALAEYNDAAARLLGVAQILRHDVEQGYIAVLGAAVSRDVAVQATARFEALLTEAQELVRLEVVPEYQLFPARMEFERRREEQLEAERLLDTSLERLKALVGSTRGIDLAESQAVLVESAATAVLPSDYDLQNVHAARGPHRSLVSQRDQAEAHLRRAQDALRSDVSLELRTTWQGEDAHAPVENHRLLSDKHLGVDAAVVYRRPVGRRAARSAIKRLRERVAELNQHMRRNEIDTERDLQTAAIHFRRATERLGIISRAVSASERALRAEEERFRLGEGRSRNVLDAQKDLTAVEQRRTGIGAAVLRAYSDFIFSSGYSLPAGEKDSTE